MKNNHYLSSWIKRFLLEYLISIRNLSKNTQLSYRDTFRLMLPFMASKAKKSRMAARKEKTKNNPFTASSSG